MPSICRLPCVLMVGRITQGLTEQQPRAGEHGGDRDRGTWWRQGNMVGTGAGGQGGDRGTWWGQGDMVGTGTGDIGAGGHGVYMGIAKGDKTYSELVS